jgi:hypothetical protein
MNTLQGLHDKIKSCVSTLSCKLDSSKDEKPLQEIQRDSPEWGDVENLVRRRNETYAGKYKFGIKVKRLWRVRQNAYMKECEERSSRLGKPMQLFHGTPAAQSIIDNGFRLPERAGMFGKGLYFACCPLKSVGYTRKGWNAIWEFAFGDALIGSKQMLLCDVYLGKTCKRFFSWSKIDPAKDLQCSSLCKCFGGRDYNSVTAATGLFGCVRVPEYIVYDAHQAIPRYLVEFEKV